VIIVKPLTAYIFIQDMSRTKIKVQTKRIARKMAQYHSMKIRKNKIKERQRENSVHTVVNQPPGRPPSDGMMPWIWSYSHPSRKASTSSPPRLVDQRLFDGKVSIPSTVAGGDAAGCAEPGGGNSGRPCGVPALIGGRAWEYGGGGGCWRLSHGFKG
jgi:hypothetical protein